MKPVFAVVAVLLCAACATIPNIDDAVVAAPVNCDTAERDLIALEQMRPTRERAAIVVLSTLTPGGLVSGIVTNDMEDRGRIFDGSFAREVNAKKRAIRETCDLNRALDPVAPTRPTARNLDEVTVVADQPDTTTLQTEAPPNGIGEALDPFRTYSDG
ncbi:hypothetical protein [Cognatishimia sp. MH4019]|uniref:hypothetical protein n=1 Tax=Cognatishimia sp. MH4019 TaxID=2854030 RepID=UPI001CD4600C|nr:hypothetical protein [Cognatishimia sp. MH4019]